MLDREEQIRLEQGARGRVCIICDGEPRIAVLHGAWGYRCNCYPNEPKLSTKRNKRLNLATRKGELLAMDMERTGQDTDLATLPDAGAVEIPHQRMSIEQYREEKMLVEAIVSDMDEGVHYGLIPGTRDKSLWEAGAEELRRAFRIRWTYEKFDEVEDFDKLEFRYRVVAWIVTPDGAPAAKWEARAWSRESRFSKGSPDLANTVLDRAIKRAFVNLIKNVTGASGLFKTALGEAPEPRAAVKNEPAPVKPAFRPTHQGLNERAHYFLDVVKKRWGKRDPLEIAFNLDIRYDQLNSITDFTKPLALLAEKWGDGPKADVGDLYDTDNKCR